MKTIKFRIVKDGKVVGYERVVDSVWFASQDDKEWFPGVFGPEDDKTVFVRQQYIDQKDKNGREIYDGDILHDEGMHIVDDKKVPYKRDIEVKFPEIYADIEEWLSPEEFEVIGGNK